MIGKFKEALYAEKSRDPTSTRVPFMFSNTSNSKSMFVAVSTRKFDIAKKFADLLIEGQMLEEKPVRALGRRRAKVERLLTSDQSFQWSDLLILDTDDDLSTICAKSEEVDKRAQELESKPLCEFCDSSAKFMTRVSDSVMNETLYLGGGSRYKNCIERFAEKVVNKKKRTFFKNLTMTLIDIGQGDYVLIFKNPLYHIGHLMDDLSRGKLHYRVFSFLLNDPIRIYRGDYSLHQQVTATKFSPTLDDDVIPMKRTDLQRQLANFKNEMYSREFGSRCPSISSEVTLRDRNHSINPFILYGGTFMTSFKVISSEPVDLKQLGEIIHDSPDLIDRYKATQYEVNQHRYGSKNIPVFSCIKGPSESFDQLLCDYFHMRFFIEDHQCVRCQRFPINNYLKHGSISNSAFLRASKRLKENCIILTDQIYPARVCPFGSTSRVGAMPNCNFFNTKKLSMWFVQLDSEVKPGQKRTVVIIKDNDISIKQFGSMLKNQQYSVRRGSEGGYCHVGKDLTEFYDK